MANSDNPHGARPISTLHGGAFYVEELPKDSGGGNIFIGDFVSREADGNIAAGGTPGTTVISGVSSNYSATGSAGTHSVYTDPAVVYEIQDNNDTDGIAAADLGLNANVEYNAGSTTTFLSGHEIDESTADVTNSLDLHLLRLFNVPDNAHGANARIEVLINKHRFGTQTVGV